MPVTGKRTVDTHPNLIKAIRTGKLSTVIAALDAGGPVELDDGKGNPGLPLAIACFLGHAEIVRELAIRGAKINFSDNSIASSPLSMAVRTGKTEVVKVLIEHGAVIPDKMETGLRKDELMLARWKAQHLGTGRTSATVDTDDVIEEIHVDTCYGTDTNILDEDMRRAIEGPAAKKK
ncbi:MAG: ankyrin repeat domain-containing protein [Candidatus Accumulibacter sp.]|nr:ankyrin repeat domain-containing protein [Accumulibacter sp.]